MRRTSHETVEILYAYSEGTLEASLTERVTAHVERCEECARRVREFHRLREGIVPPAADPPTSGLRNALLYALAEGNASPSGPRQEILKENPMRPATSAPPFRRWIPVFGSAALWYWVIGAALAAAVTMSGYQVYRHRTAEPANPAQSFSKYPTTFPSQAYPPMEAMPSYEKALQAYQAGKNEEATGWIKTALTSRLTFNDPPYKQFAVLRELARKNGSYALALAATGPAADAKKVNALSGQIAAQIRRDTQDKPSETISELVARALDKYAARIDKQLK